ncbi:unnamed protein product [Paramecium octaurelia]|uniref:SPRY domain-containing protein n=1 Tax=Paramecium octaurelia TaxID=43137 RepID=A0A8S1U721_PAROT|nr:unnamed protein product [Paramecium octaurelia]
MKQLMLNMVKTYKQMNKPDDKQNIKNYGSIQYPECTLGGNHSGEILSLICLEKECQQNQILCCCICQEEFHKGHQLKPLKLLLCEYDQKQKEFQSGTLKQSEKDLLVKKINEKEIISLEQTRDLQQQIVQKLNKIQDHQKQFFENLRKLVKLREIDNGNTSLVIENILNNQQNSQLFGKFVKELLDALIIQELPDQDLGYEELNKAFDFHIKDQSDRIKQLEKQMFIGVHQQIEFLMQKTSKNLIQTSCNFEFLHNNKHPQVEIVEPQIVKASQSTHGYKFAVMNPSLDKNQVTVFGFKLNNVHSSNWLAVGACHLSVVQSKQFGFAFQSLGHGGYLVSSNGGAWSSTTANQNNVVKCFKFGKGDLIVITYDPKNDTMTFTKQKTKTTFKLDVPKSDNNLHPCVLFYYALDEVEFISSEGINQLLSSDAIVEL